MVVLNSPSLINLISAAGSSVVGDKVKEDFGTFNLPLLAILIIFPVALPPRCFQVTSEPTRNLDLLNLIPLPDLAVYLP